MGGKVIGNFIVGALPVFSKLLMLTITTTTTTILKPFDRDYPGDSVPEG